MAELRGQMGPREATQSSAEQWASTTIVEEELQDESVLFSQS